MWVGDSGRSQYTPDCDMSSNIENPPRAYVGGFAAGVFISYGHVGLALATPGRQQRRVQSFAAEHGSDPSGAFGLAGRIQDTLLVSGTKRRRLACATILGVGAGFRIGAGDGTGILRLVVHQENLSRPAFPADPSCVEQIVRPFAQWTV